MREKRMRAGEVLRWREDKGREKYSTCFIFGGIRFDFVFL
jgi:hypothetical protein